MSLLFQAAALAVVSAQTDTNSAPTLSAPPTLSLQLSTPPASTSAGASSPTPSYADPAAAVMRSLIIDACQRNDLTHATYLLDHGAPVDARGKGDVTPLILAAQRNPELVKLLLAHGASLELKETNGYTALGAACWSGQTACAGVLIDAGANAQVLNNKRHTPLILAIEARDDDLVQALVDHHVDVNQSADDGSAIWWAIEKDRPKELAMLLAAGADFQPHNTVTPSPDRPNYTVVGKAATGTDTTIVDLLLAHGANINEPDALGRPPLFLALENAKAPMILYLLQKGADATKTDNSGGTAS